MAEVQREAYLGELKTLAELRGRFAGEPLVGLLVEAAVLHTEANLRVVELAEGLSAELTHSAADAASGDRGRLRRTAEGAA